jgi:hypothetical protein
MFREFSKCRNVRLTWSGLKHALRDEQCHTAPPGTGVSARPVGRLVSISYPCYIRAKIGYTLMSMIRVYADTSVFGGPFDEEFQTVSSSEGLWNHRDIFPFGGY